LPVAALLFALLVAVAVVSLIYVWIGPGADRPGETRPPAVLCPSPVPPGQPALGGCPAGSLSKTAAE